MTTAVVFNFVQVSENICTIYLENIHTEYGKCVATVALFAETFNKKVSNVLCEKPIILVELLFELRIVVRVLSFKIVQMAKRLLAKMRQENIELLQNVR